MDSVILFRKSLAEEDEIECAKKYFNVVESRMSIPSGTLVIPRYSSLPFYKELVEDCNILGAQLSNSLNQYQYIANLRNWYEDLKKFTPRTWFSLEESIAQQECVGSFVLKGNINSRKQLWRTHMYALNKSDIMRVYLNLQDDSLIGEQDICVREFEKFKSYGQQINGMPIIKEFRFFVWDKTILSGGYYWSNFPEVVEKYRPDYQEAIPFVNKIIDIVNCYARFYVIDVGQREDGQYRLIELNDGQMAGLSCISPDELYKNLRQVLGA